MILSRVKISPQQRYDLEDFYAGLAAARADEKLWTKTFLSDQNLILNGFSVSGIGLNSATVSMSDAALILPQNSFDFSYFVSAPSDPDLTISDADLADASRNFVEAELQTLDGTPLAKAFWDPEANSGSGAEFNQVVDTITELQVNLVVSTSGFSGSPDRVPIAIIDTDGSGVIKVILDRRELYGRLAKPNDLDNEYAWGTKQEPAYQLNMTGVVGTFQAGEEISIGGETATVVTGGGASITFNEPTGINFGNGDAVMGVTSGATGTVNTVLESFLGVDKNLSSQKEINDALMTEFKKIKGTRFWWQASPSLAGVKQEVMSVVVPLSSGARVVWNGSNLRITDNSNSPSSSDNIAAIRVLSSAVNLNLRRQDDGKEVVTISLSDVPNAGILTIDQNGNLIPINWDDTSSDIQTAWNLSGAFAATISGSPADKLIVITANSPGLQVDASVSSNTLNRSGSAVTPTISIKQGQATDTSLPIADGEVLYVDLASPLASTNYSDLGVGATNFKVAPRGSLSIVDATYWLAYREGSKLIWRFSGELGAGESSEISDNVPQSLLDALGLASESSMPSYDSNIRGTANESIVKRVSKLTDSVGDAQEDRSGLLRSDDPVTWDGVNLSFTSDIVLDLINTKSGTLTQHTIQTASSPIILADGESAYILIDRNATSENCTVKLSGTDPIPAQSQANKDIFVLFYRKDAPAGSFLHVPFHKQLIEMGQTVRLGSSGASVSSTPPLFIQEVPSGVVDGINDTFVITHTPKSTETLFVTVDTVKVPESDWSLIGLNVVFDPGFEPQPGQSVEVFYVADTSNSLSVVQEVPAGLVDGLNDTFTVVGTPPSAAAMIVFVDGLKTLASEWSLTGPNTFQFDPGSIPQPGQSVEVYMVVSLDTTQVFQEIPVGLVDGINDTFDLSGVPPYKAAVMVFVNGRKVDVADWNLIFPGLTASVQFDPGSLPQPGQSVEVMFFVVAGGVGSVSLQGAYNNGNTITTTLGNPVIFGGAAAKVAQFNGDIGVTGVIDPAGITFTEQLSNPLSGTDNGLWVNSSGELVHSRPSMPDINVTQAVTNSASYVEKFTLTGTDITNGFVTLANASTSPADTILSVIGGVEQDYSVDFTVSGSTLSWSALGLDGVLTAGDKITVQYR